MNNIKHFINGNQTDSLPANNNTFGVVIDWTGSKEVNVDFDTQKWFGPDAETILNERSNGLGSFVGIPYKIEVDGVALPDLMLDLRKFTKYGCNEVDVGVKLKQNIDWFRGEAGVLQFARLEELGLFTNSDKVNVPYNINYIPDGLEVLMLSISTYLMAKELALATKELAHSVTEAATAVSTLSPFGAALAIANALLRLAYFVSIVIAIINLVKAILENLYSKTRHHTGLKVKSMFQKACTFLNLSFASTIFDDSRYANLVYLPIKTERGRFNASQFTPCSPTRNDAGMYFFGEFLETMMKVFNADYRIYNGQLRFERWDWWANNSTYILPDNFNNQERMINVLGDNADDFKGGYTISFEFDTKDQNTYDNIDNMAYDVITTTATTLVGYENAHGVEVVQLPMARAKRKGSLSRFENVLSGLLSFIDTVTGVLTFGNGTNFASEIQNRISNMELSDHFTGVGKLVFMNTNGVGLAIQQADAKELWDNFHFINSFKKINNKHNQWENYKMNLSFCAKDLLILLENNFAETSDGQTVEIESVKWVPFEDEAEIEYRINNQYTTNLRQDFIATKNSSNATNPDV